MKEASFIQQALNQSFTKKQDIQSIKHASGGMINHSLIVQTNTETLFLKWNDDPNAQDLFEKEAAGLAALSKGTLRVPKVISFGSIENKYYLILEYISQGLPSHSFWQSFGTQLAILHQITNNQFGWSTDDHFGKLPQLNSYSDDWTDFFINSRLIPQIYRGLKTGTITSELARKFEALYPKLDGFFPVESPALIHGDLWSGNFMSDEMGNPVVFDPAVYFGHREIELAFTRLFGGFDASFYWHYQNYYPLAPGFEEREDIYNLYPLLVHVNLFGGSYLSGIKQTLRRFL